MNLSRKWLEEFVHVDASDKEFAEAMTLSGSQVDAGREQPVQIVTGAWNVHAGDLVPVALHKSTLPGG